MGWAAGRRGGNEVAGDLRTSSPPAARTTGWSNGCLARLLITRNASTSNDDAGQEFRCAAVLQAGLLYEASGEYNIFRVPAGRPARVPYSTRSDTRARKAAESGRGHRFGGQGPARMTRNPCTGPRSPAKGSKCIRVRLHLMPGIAMWICWCPYRCLRPNRRPHCRSHCRPRSPWHCCPSHYRLGGPAISQQLLALRRLVHRARCAVPPGLVLFPEPGRPQKLLSGVHATLPALTALARLRRFRCFHPVGVAP